MPKLGKKGKVKPAAKPAFGGKIGKGKMPKAGC